MSITGAPCVEDALVLLKTGSARPKCAAPLVLVPCCSSVSMESIRASASAVASCSRSLTALWAPDTTEGYAAGLDPPTDALSSDIKLISHQELNCLQNGTPPCQQFD